MERSGLCDDAQTYGHKKTLKYLYLRATGDTLERYFSRSPDLTIRTCAQPAA